MKKSRLLLTIIGIAPFLMAMTYRPENMIIHGYDKVTAKVTDASTDGSMINHIEVHNEGDGYVTYPTTSDICFTIHEENGSHTGTCYGSFNDAFFINQVLGPGETATYVYKDNQDRSVGDELDISTFCLSCETIAHVSSYKVSYDENMFLYLYLDIYDDAATRNHLITVCEAEYDGKPYSFMVRTDGLIAKHESIIDVNKFVVKEFRFFSTNYEEPSSSSNEVDFESRQNLIHNIEVTAGIIVLVLALSCGVAAIVVPKVISKKNK